jgi:agmatinase
MKTDFDASKNTAETWPDFIGSERPERSAEDSLFHVIPAPLEQTVSYGGGTADGPRAILEASQQLEAYDGHSCPCEAGIFTHPCAPDLDAIQQVVGQVLQAGKIPVVLGGEHSVSLGAFRALAKQDEPIGIIQFDAHADLRDTYEGSPLSHACVMRRALELDLPVMQVGVRALSVAETKVREQFGVHYLDGETIGMEGVSDQWLPTDFPGKVYVTVDIDVLDSSLMPATGTPEPGGLSWWTMMRMLGDITRQHQVVGFDCVELAPVPGLHAADFTAARLVYNFMGMIERA